MKAWVLQGAGSLELADVPQPEPEAGQVLIAVDYCGICGSDLEAYELGMYEPGMVIGHEFAGHIAAVGPGVQGWEVGTTVSVSDAIPCMACRMCRRGALTQCESLVMIGVTVPGALAEYVAVPVEGVYRLPKGLDTRRAALAEPLSIALHAVNRSSLRPGDRALVLGAGPIGLLVLQAARLAGALEVYVVEPNPARAALAARLGAAEVLDPTRTNLAVRLGQLTGGTGVEVAFVCTGAAAAFEEAVTLVGKGGQIVMVGLAPEPAAGDLMTLVLHELDVRGAYLGHGEFAQALAFIAQGRVDVESLISREVPLERALEDGFAYLLSGAPEAAKVLVRVRD
jgi:2-desacetyl-2-hydroxyethyl bacteriochlorophyllide A dehydrogenase